MKSLKVVTACRTLHNRSWTHHRLFKSLVIPQPSYKSGHDRCNYYSLNDLRFYYISSANSIDSAPSSQTHQSKFQPATDTAEMSNLTDDELLKILIQLKESILNKSNKELKGYNKTSFGKLIEKECTRRARKNWNLDETLDLLDMLYPQGKFLCPSLLFWLLKMRFKVALKSETTTLMKYVAVMNKYQFWEAYHFNCYHIEFMFTKRLDHLGLSQISALLHVLNIRLARIVSQELINTLYDRLIKEIDSVDFRTLNTFLLFFSNQQTHIDFHQIIPHLTKKLKEADFIKTEGIVMFCLRKKIYNPEIVDHLAQHLIKRLPYIKINELKNIITSLVFYNYNSRDIYQKLIDNFELEPLRTTLMEHPKQLAKILGDLCLINIYPYKYIDQVLSKEFLLKTFGKKLNRHTVLREVMILDGCVKAECPDYEGNILDEDLEKKLTTWWSSHIHHYLRTEGDTTIVPKPKSVRQYEIEYEPTVYNEIILDARGVLRNLLGGSEYVHTCYTLPFLPRPDLLFCLGREKNPIKLPDQVLNSIRIDYKNLDQSVDWYVIMCVHQHPILKGENILIYGKDIAKERIFRKRGFKLITIVHELWCNWTEEKKKEYFGEFIR